MTKQLVTIGAAVMTTLLALVLLWQFQIIVVYLLISLTLAAAVRPLIRRRPGRGFWVRLAWILLYLVVLGGFGFLLFLTGKLAIVEIQNLIHTVSTQQSWRVPAWLEGSYFQQLLVTYLPPPNRLFEAVTGSQGELVLPDLLGFTQGFRGIVSAIPVILFLTIYWIINQVHFERLWLSLLPSAQRKQARDIWRTIEPNLGAYIRTQVVHSLLVGVLLALGYWLLGSPFPVLLALAGALACLIPVIGAPLAVIPPLLMGLLTGVQLSLLTVLFTVIVLIALAVWVKPRLFKRTWDNPVLTLMILIFLANAYGLLGIIIAPPISAICQILWSLQVSHRLALGAAAHVSDLKERLEHVWDIIRAMDALPLPLVTSSMERLTGLLAQAEPILQAALPEPVHLLQPVVTEGGPPAPTKP